MTREEFCKQLIDCRKASGVKMKDMCFAMGVMPTTIYRLESAKNSFSIDNVFMYLKAIECQMSLKNSSKKNKSFAINKYQDIIDWLVKSRKPDYTQRSLAERIDCSHITIANYESGKNIIGVDIFLRIIDALEFTVELKSKTE
jgi:transcriptional regulator with XRE-family HTH domain